MNSFKELAVQFEKRLQQSDIFPEQPEHLYDPCKYFMKLGGKRIRPALCLMGNELFSDITEDAWHAAISIELFHNFTLVHDDIMDKAPLRRGKPTVHTQFGLTAGILSGDVLCIYAYQQLAKIKHALPEIMHLFNTTAIEVCEGQQLDMDFEKRNDVQLDEYMQMITQKTSVLLAASLKIGALLGGATPGNADKIYAFGKNLGIAFQLQDDYLDAFGEAGKTGKQNGGDITDNKKTLLLLTALQNGTTQHKQKIRKLLDDHGEHKVPEMLNIFRDTGADKKCLDDVKAYSEKAYQCLEDIAVVSKRKHPLEELAAALLNREN